MANGSYAVGDRHTDQTAAIFECVIANGSYAAGDRHTDQTAAILECVIANGSYAAGDRHTGQTAAIQERTLANGSHTLFNRHRFDLTPIVVPRTFRRGCAILHRSAAGNCQRSIAVQRPGYIRSTGSRIDNVSCARLCCAQNDLQSLCRSVYGEVLFVFFPIVGNLIGIPAIGKENRGYALLVRGGDTAGIGLHAGIQQHDFCQFHAVLIQLDWNILHRILRLGLDRNGGLECLMRALGKAPVPVADREIDVRLLALYFCNRPLILPEISEYLNFQRQRGNFIHLALKADYAGMYLTAGGSR